MVCIFLRKTIVMTKKKKSKVRLGCNSSYMKIIFTNNIGANVSILFLRYPYYFFLFMSKLVFHVKMVFDVPGTRLNNRRSFSKIIDAQKPTQQNKKNKEVTPCEWYTVGAPVVLWFSRKSTHLIGSVEWFHHCSWKRQQQCHQTIKIRKYRQSMFAGTITATHF